MEFLVSIGKWVLKNLFEKYVPVHTEAYDREQHRQLHLEDPPSQLPVPTTVITNERNEVVNGNDTQNPESLAAVSAQNGGARPTINTSPEGLKGPIGTEFQAPSSESSKGTSASLTPQDLNSTTAQQPPTSSPGLAPSSSAAVALKPLSSGSLAASPTVSSVASPTTSSSSNGLMGRLKQSVKKLARSPSAEQRFENGRPISSRKSFGAQTPTTTTTSATLVSSQGALSSPAVPDSTTASLAGVSAAGTAPGTTTNTSAASSPRTTIVDGVGLVTPGTLPVAVGALGLGLTKGTEDDRSTLDSNSSLSVDSMPSPVVQLPSSTISVRPPHPPFTPPTDCPPTKIPAHIPVIISEQSREASSSVDLYRGSVGTLGQDYIPLVQIMPNWLLEVLLKNTIPLKEVGKISFVLRPHHDQEATTGTVGPATPGRLGELPGGNPRLTAPRMLRVRKVVTHVAEKLSLSPPKYMLEAAAALIVASSMESPTATHQAESSHPPPQQQQSPRALESVQEEEGPHGSTEQDRPPSSLSVQSASSASHLSPSASPSSSPNARAATIPGMSANGGASPLVLRVAPPETSEEEYLREECLRPENWLEILCNDQVLPPTMTLATIRTHHWKSGSDVVLTYRYKSLAPLLSSSSASSQPNTPALSLRTTLHLASNGSSPS